MKPGKSGRQGSNTGPRGKKHLNFSGKQPTKPRPLPTVIDPSSVEGLQRLIYNASRATPTSAGKPKSSEVSPYRRRMLAYQERQQALRLRIAELQKKFINAQGTGDSVLTSQIRDAIDRLDREMGRLRRKIGKGK